MDFELSEEQNALQQGAIEFARSALAHDVVGRDRERTFRSRGIRRWLRLSRPPRPDGETAGLSHRVGRNRTLSVSTSMISEAAVVADSRLNAGVKIIGVPHAATWCSRPPSLR